MKKIRIFTAGLALALLSAIPALAIGPVDMTVKTDYASRYIWRGFDLQGNGDAAQPSVSASMAATDALSLSVGVWGNFDVDNTERWTEFDYTASASYAVNDMISVGAGFIYYSFPQVEDSDLDNTQEVFVTASVAPVEGLTIAAGFYYDYDDGEGYYLTGSADYAYPITDKTSLSVGASIGYMNYDDDGVYAGYDGVSDTNVRAGISTSLTDSLGMGITCTYTMPDEDINQDNEVWTLASISYAF